MVLLALAGGVALACSPSSSGSAAGDATTRGDTGPEVPGADAAPRPDADAPADAVAPDAGAPADAVAPDAGAPDASPVGGPDAAVGSCAGRCGAAYDEAAPCQCNVGCGGFGNCCADYDALCLPALTTCEGRCGIEYQAALPCQCNMGCEQFGNCCADHAAQCLPALSTCAGRCGAAYDDALPCQCNDRCANFGNCCEDFAEACGAPCEPACAEFETCQDGTCEGRACAQPAECPNADCFQGRCAEGGCGALCDATYGAGIWTCYAGGWCGRLECSLSGDCRGESDCVAGPAPRDRDPEGGVVDYQCRGAADSPCRGACGPFQRCDAASAECR